jgi:hypothetical protein
MFHHHRSRYRRTFAVLAIPVVAAFAALGAASAASAGTYTSGAWTLQAPSTDSFSAQVQQPINADGSSVFSHKSSTIPVQFKVTDTQGFTFESLNPSDPNYLTSGNGENDYSALSYTPPAGTTVSGIIDLEAAATFTAGSNGGGALRWSVNTPIGNIFVYYGTGPGFTDNLVQSGNLIANTSDVRVDTSQLPGGTFYDTWAHALTLAGSQPVGYTALVLDGGWSNPAGQVMNLTSATVNGNAFTMPGTITTQTNTAPAWIYLDKTSGVTTAPIDETTLTSTQGDSGGQFRQVDGKYIYNLPVNDLQGASGDIWKVGISLTQNGSPIPSTVKFALK